MVMSIQDQVSDPINNVFQQVYRKSGSVYPVVRIAMFQSTKKYINRNMGGTICLTEREITAVEDLLRADGKIQQALHNKN